MTIEEIVRRKAPPEPWSEGEKIPWNEPEFSERMLREHLAQKHDLTSRRLSVIDAHWPGWGTLARELHRRTLARARLDKVHSAGPCTVPARLERSSNGSTQYSSVM